MSRLFAAPKILNFSQTTLVCDYEVFGYLLYLHGYYLH